MIPLGVVTSIGVVGYAVIGGTEHGLVDAVYMTVITLTTVGFGEIIDMSSSPAGRVFTLLLLLFGFAIVLCRAVDDRIRHRRPAPKYFCEAEWKNRLMHGARISIG